jgi:hypothetical protein
VSLDVLEEHPFGRDLADDAGDLGPQVAGIGGPAALARDAERLAGITGSDEMNAVAPRAAVEGSQVVPDSSRCHGRVRHPGHEGGRRMSFPLDVTNSSVAGFGDADPEVEATVAGAERDAAEVTAFGLVVDAGVFGR